MRTVASFSVVFALSLALGGATAVWLTNREDGLAHAVFTGLAWRPLGMLFGASLTLNLMLAYGVAAMSTLWALAAIVVSNVVLVTPLCLKVSRRHSAKTVATQ